MSRQRALDTLNGRPTDRVAQLEWNAPPDFLREVIGIDPYKNPSEAWLSFVERFDIDATIRGGAGVPSAMGGDVRRDRDHAYTQWGIGDTSWLTDPIYKTADQILAFDPRSHDKSSRQEKADTFARCYHDAQDWYGDRAQFIPGHYQLVVHYMPYWCDWAVFMELLASEPDRCRPLFDRCEDYSVEIMEAWANSGAPAFIAHEDLCSTRGPIFSPEFLRREIFPRYKRIYEPLRRKGIKVLATSDGLIESIAPDLMDAGADGLFLEPMNDIGRMVDLVGPGGILWGGGSSVVVTTGTPVTIREDVRQRMQQARRLPGFFFALGGEAPHNVPAANFQAYLSACAEYGKRCVSTREGGLLPPISIGEQAKGAIAIASKEEHLISKDFPMRDIIEDELSEDWAFLQSFVPAYNRVWTSKPVVETENTVYAPLLGNGSMCVCVGGEIDTLVYYMRTADFWTDDGASDGKYHHNNLGEATGDGKVREIPSGCLKIGVDKGSAPAASPPDQFLSYRHEEDALNAEIRSTLPFSGHGLKVVAYVAAMENTMVVELSSTEPVMVNVELNTDVLDRIAAYPARAGVDGKVMFLTRETNNRSGARWISRNAYATRILGSGPVTYDAVDSLRTRATFEIPAGATVTVVTCLDGGKDATDHLQDAMARAKRMTAHSIADLKSDHRDWWKRNWWLKSYVRTYDDMMDKYYYHCLYLLGTMCREGSVNSGLHGPWKASDTRHNYSSYCMNDLGAASYYIPLISSDRANAAKMWIQTVHDWIAEGRRRAVDHAGLTRGVFFPVHWAPWGSTHQDVYWGQKFCATFASLIGNWYYRNTEDVDYLKERIYPFMKECADFYEDWLTREVDGKYHVRGASYENDTDNCENSCLDLVYAGILFTDIVKYSKVLDVDSRRRAKWEEIRDNLNDFSTTSVNGRTVFLADSRPKFDHSINVIQTQVVYPGYTCNRRSAPRRTEIGFNTISEAIVVAARDGLGQDNMRGQGSFVAAQRIGKFKVEDLIAAYHTMLSARHGSYAACPADYTAYIADAGLWEFNNQLCMQCFGEEVIFFPDYPSGRKLSFKRLLAPGAFLCAGEFRDGKIAALKVHSRNGNPFTVVGSRGKDSSIDVRDDLGRSIPVRKHDDRSTFSTAAGRTYDIACTS